ncbi:MAG: L-threonylcarbamoyladenylate synthase [Candidatus Woesearchaeota archaeon]|jgi:L-threonylcarbamoyladenylate synthase|nr:L-threonylcarbamoyladenylate synthase [Candidatus Woesearchaeota archaeon]|tara:strand:+ start:2107 stop:2646 length:540 start_codon:yes stop_codon:yes gene_type:complete
MLEEIPIINSIRDGAVFIHPTDTIYGIGCNAQNSEAIKKIRELKARSTSPFSVIPPSLKWIKENCLVTEEAEKWVRELPGPFTLILKLKKDCVAKEVNPGLKTIGVRMPRHRISKIVAKANVPIVTTSVNRGGEDYMTCLEDLDPAIKGGVKFLLYEGKKEGRPSKIVDLTSNVKIIER